MILNVMEPRTCGQGTTDWFLDRQLSMTSSTASNLVIAVASIISKEDDISEAFKTVLDYAGYTEVLGRAIREEEPQEQEGVTSQE